MIPTIVSVLPGKGHTGGQQLIELTATNLALPPPPPNVIPLPAPPVWVQVLFGGVPATDVQLVDSTLLYCVTPIHDPGLVDVVVQNLGETPASMISGAGPFAVSPGNDLEVAVNGGAPQPLVFASGDIASPGAATALEVAAAVNRMLGLSAIVTNGAVVASTDLRGASSSIQVTGGAAATALGFTPGVQVGNGTLVPIPGEIATFKNGYEFARPDLTKKLPITLAIEQLMVELGRQVIANVNIATHSDFDADTGDLLNTAMLATLPGLILADVQLPDSRMPIFEAIAETADGANGGSLVREPVDLVDILVSVVAVSDDPIELVNLAAITRRFFRKNAWLTVPIDPNDATKGTFQYPMAWEMGTPINITAQRGGENLQTFTGQAVVFGVPAADMPIAYTGAMPVGVPPGTEYEGVREIGWVRQVATEIGLDSASG